MAFSDKVSDGIGQAARELEKALDKGKMKFGELQIEMQMDGLAKKLGYLVFDFYRGRAVDQAVRQKVLDDLSRLEDQLWQMRAEAAAKTEADAQARAAAKAQETQEGYGDQMPPQGGAGGETYRPPNP
jgi:hypothetical protein